MVAVAKKNDSVKVCSHCRHSLSIRVGGDFGFRFHWVGDFYLGEG